MLDEGYLQTHKKFAEELGVNQKIVSNRPREMGKIQNNGRWVPHELNDRQMEKRKNTHDSVQKEIIFASYSYEG